MERTLIRRISAALVAVLVAFSMLQVSAGEASAADGWTLFTTECYAGSPNSFFDVERYNEAKGDWEYGVVTKVTSSNTKVLKFRKEKWKDEDGNVVFSMIPKKAGKAKIKVSFTAPDGTKSTISKNVTVKKYPKQIKSLKVNGKTVNTSKGKKRYEYMAYNYKGSKAYIKMATKNGWKISDIYGWAWSSKSGKDKNVKVTKSNLAKGSAIKFPKGYDYLGVTVTMTKGSHYISYNIGISKNKY